MFSLRICYLLELWIANYRGDFAVPGTAGALHALIKQTLRHPHTLYYGSDLLPFIEILPTLVDEDSSWAIKSDVPSEESDDSDFYDEGMGDDSEQVSSPVQMHPVTDLNDEVPPTRSGRDRKSSLPLAAKSILQGSLTSNFRSPTSSSPPSAKEVLSRLVRTANALLHYSSEAVAQEITRRDVILFMQIEVSISSEFRI